MVMVLEGLDMPIPVVEHMVKAMHTSEVAVLVVVASLVDQLA